MVIQETVASARPVHPPHPRKVVLVVSIALLVGWSLLLGWMAKRVARTETAEGCKIAVAGLLC
ncbi:MAG: hypothetical protein ACC645_07890 [Pirellulales bacterium]